MNIADGISVPTDESGPDHQPVEHFIDSDFPKFYTAFQSIVTPPLHDTQAVLDRVANLIECDLWCFQKCGRVCSSFAGGDADEARALAGETLGVLCDGFRRGNRKVLTWRGKKSYFERMFKTAAVRIRYKSRKRREVAMRNELVSAEPGPAERLSANEQLEQLRGLIQDIRSPNDKQIVLWRGEGKSFAEIATQLPVPVTAEVARQRYGRCCNELRRRADALGLAGD